MELYCVISQEIGCKYFKQEILILCISISHFPYNEVFKQGFSQFK